MRLPYSRLRRENRYGSGYEDLLLHRRMLGVSHFVQTTLALVVLSCGGSIDLKLP